jgi:hypothetical protein
MTVFPFKNIVSITKPAIPHAMIDGIRRRLGRSIDEDPWNTNLEFKPELAETAELPADTAVLVTATQATGEYSPGDDNTTDYYRSIVSTAIENGGRHGDHHIPIPWLRMILAGLEFKHIEPEMMWYGVEAGTAVGEPLPEIPSYGDLFPSETTRPEPQTA